MTIDWTVIGVLVAVAALLIAILQLQRTPRSSAGRTNKKVHVLRHEVKGDIPDHLRDALGSFTITAERFEFHNESGRDLANVRIRISPVQRLISAKVASTKKLAKEAVSIETLEKSVAIVMAEMPKSEVFSIDIISSDYYFGWERVRSENSSIELVERT